LLLINNSGYSAVTFDANDVITAITATAYEWLVEDENGGLEQTITNEAAGTPFVGQVLSANFHNITEQDLKEIRNMVAGRPHVLIEDYNGKYFLVGYQTGCLVAGTGAGTGTAAGDVYGHALTFTANEKTFAYMVDSSAISGVTIVTASSGS
jgi:hypothetical protein